jgi:cadmium resistance protein CadD (predicted permease)
LGSVLRHRRTYMVSAVTISNGGNNLAIYIPLLGTSSAFAAALTVVVCYLAVACWLLLSFRLTRLPGVAVTLSRYGRRLFPFVLMWLGFRILHDSGVLADLRSLG